MNKLNEKQKRFVTEYCIDMNGTQAAIRAGYSKRTANEQASALLAKPNIKTAVEENLKTIRDKNLCDAYEVEAYLASVLRGRSEGEVVIVEGIGEGRSQARRMMKKPDERDKLEAAKILAKRFGLTDAKMKLEGGLNLSFSGEKDLE